MDSLLRHNRCRSRSACNLGRKNILSHSQLSVQLRREPADDALVQPFALGRNFCIKPCQGLDLAKHRTAVVRKNSVRLPVRSHVTSRKRVKLGAYARFHLPAPETQPHYAVVRRIRSRPFPHTRRAVSPPTGTRTVQGFVKVAFAVWLRL